jgi:hypothetical protein
MKDLKGKPEGMPVIEWLKYRIIQGEATKTEVTENLPSLLRSISSAANFDLDTGWVDPIAFNDLLRLYQRILLYGENDTSPVSTSFEIYDMEYASQFQRYLQEVAGNCSGVTRKRELGKLLTLYFLAPSNNGLYSVFYCTR